MSVCFFYGLAQIYNFINIHVYVYQAFLCRYVTLLAKFVNISALFNLLN